MIDRFEIIGQSTVRRPGQSLIFCDGTGGDLFQEATDLELSHWRPNRTPAEYRAGTSTEICFRFVDSPRPGNWTAAVNNHVDVDGILSVYVLVHTRHARQHRQALIEAAEIGDFWQWGQPIAQRVFQGLTQIMHRGAERDPREIYQEAFQRIPGLIDGTDPQCGQLDESLDPLQNGVRLVEQGTIRRTLINRRCAQYVLPYEVVGHDVAAALYVPSFNEIISDKAILWPQVRTRWDAERACLESIEQPSGWYHAVFFPGYLWADTSGRWIVPGLRYHDGMADYDLDYPPFAQAMQTLQQLDSAAGHWQHPQAEDAQRQQIVDLFPLVARRVDDQGQWATSALSPEQVAGVFAEIDWG